MSKLTIIILLILLIASKFLFGGVREKRNLEEDLRALERRVRLLEKVQLNYKHVLEAAHTHKK